MSGEGPDHHHKTPAVPANMDDAAFWEIWSWQVSGFRLLAKEIYEGEIKADSYQPVIRLIFENTPWTADAISAVLIQWDDRSDCYLDRSEDRGCSIALYNSLLIYFALSFIYLFSSFQVFSRENTEGNPSSTGSNSEELDINVFTKNILS